MTNPLLTPFELPPFSKILPEHVVPAVTKALNDCRENVERVVAQGAPYTWENLCQPLAEVDDVLGRIFSPVSHLNSVKNSPELREAYEQTLPLLSEYSTWVGAPWMSGAGPTVHGVCGESDSVPRKGRFTWTF